MSRKIKHDQTSHISQVFAFWKWCMGKERARFTPGRRRKIEARLRDGYTVEDIIQAICGCSGSAWHMGDNHDGTKYDSLTLICREGEKLERFMDMTTQEAASETYRRFEKETGIDREGNSGTVVQFRGNEPANSTGN